ncbi:uncharacterized protein LOC128860264 isoform X1 [Anastrepha ludens]|uniref:uncharacterized protein LOC128860264 isoform X1 n=1 Tax=Anastrepha ludens TaxID=28586 RepID=UPI0023AF1D29|nr:uncharacterized protein LOC128860264 isoform X1 [Anastrepha ludens]
MRRTFGQYPRGLFYLSDEKFVKTKLKKQRKIHPLDTYKFCIPSVFPQPVGFEKNSVPIEFQVTPETLLNLAAGVVDALPLPNVYEWTNADVCKWIRQYGYPQYQNTFRVNLITGRKLLLVDAQALTAMNIKEFNEVKHIAYGIRQLFFYEMTKYMRSISLPPEYYYELFKLFKVSIRPSYETIRRSDLWRQLQLLRERSKPTSHWDLLERWLSRRHETVELIGGAPRYKLYPCKAGKTLPPASPTPKMRCTCRSPCQCADALPQKPTILKSLTRDRKPVTITENVCGAKCLPPPCTCNWPYNFYKFNEVLSCLQHSFPHKYEKQNNRLVTRESISLTAHKASQFSTITARLK